jgi:hypothetical protein
LELNKIRKEKSDFIFTEFIDPKCFR